MFMIVIVKILISDLFAFLVLGIFFHRKFTPRNDCIPKLE